MYDVRRPIGDQPHRGRHDGRHRQAGTPDSINAERNLAGRTHRTVTRANRGLRRGPQQPFPVACHVLADPRERRRPGRPCVRPRRRGRRADIGGGDDPADTGRRVGTTFDHSRDLLAAPLGSLAQTEPDDPFDQNTGLLTTLTAGAVVTPVRGGRVLQQEGHDDTSPDGNQDQRPPSSERADLVGGEQKNVPRRGRGRGSTDGTMHADTIPSPRLLTHRSDVTAGTHPATP
ncbi:hypothetical protein [Micromonospora chokoriensis]